MFGIKSSRIGATIFAVTVIFTLGVILGTVSLYFVPQDIVSEVREGFQVQFSTDMSFAEMYRINFTAEILWIILIWIISSNSYTIMFTMIIPAVKGFVIGFTAAFILAAEKVWSKNYICSILPQSVITIPVMAIFTAVCIHCAADKNRMGNYMWRYFLVGASFMLSTIVFSFFETWITRFFITSL